MKEIDDYKYRELFPSLWLTISIKIDPTFKEDDEDEINDKFEKALLEKGLTDKELENLSEEEILALLIKNA